MGVAGASFAIGECPTVAIRTGFALAQIGEFSFIMAEVGRSNGATRDFLYSLAVAVSTITAFLTPFLIRGSEPVALWLEHHVPRPIANIATHYMCWMSRFRSRPQMRKTSARLVCKARAEPGTPLRLDSFPYSGTILDQ
ncbi:MAG TPA: hypothetical protein VN754_02925 [Candidatus Binataceae bacterium]|nr:hypothetical protein [Candidatus Binataceae bacterium]